MTLKDDINAVATADAGVASAQATVAQATAALASANASVGTAQAADTAADQQLSADLQANGPVFITDADGSISVYAYSAAAPGYTITKAQPAGSVNGVSPSTPSTPSTPATPTSTSS